MKRTACPAAVPGRSPAAASKAKPFPYKPRFGLIIEVADEPAQRREFRRLARLGYRPRVVCV